MLGATESKSQTQGSKRYKKDAIFSWKKYKKVERVNVEVQTSFKKINTALWNSSGHLISLLHTGIWHLSLYVWKCQDSRVLYIKQKTHAY